MTALPIDPTPEQLHALWRSTSAPRGIIDPLTALFQAGVEAERARAARGTPASADPEEFEATFLRAIAEGASQ